MAEMQPITSEQIAQADAGAANNEAQGGAYIADRFRVDNDAPAGPPANYTFAGVCAIIAFLLFVVVLGILVQDWNFLKVA